MIVLFDEQEDVDRRLGKGCIQTEEERTPRLARRGGGRGGRGGFVRNRLLIVATTLRQRGLIRALRNGRPRKAPKRDRKRNKRLDDRTRRSIRVALIANGTAVLGENQGWTNCLAEPVRDMKLNDKRRADTFRIASYRLP